MKRFLKYIKPYRSAFILGPLMMLTEVFGEIWIPRLMSMIINNGVARHDTAYILRIGLVMLGACLIMVIGGTLGCYFAARASIGFSGDLRKDLYDKVQEFSFQELDVFSIGSLITRLTNDVQQIQFMIAMSLRMALRSPGMLIGALIMAAGINRELAAILLLVIPCLALSIFLIIRTAYPRLMQMQKALDRLNSGIQEALVNVRVIKSFVREDLEKEKFEKKNEDLKERTLRAMHVIILTMPVMSLFMNLTSVAVVWFGGNRVIAGNMLVGDLTAFITYITQILIALMMVAMIILQSSRSMASFKRTAEVLDTEPSVSDAGAEQPEKQVEQGSIEFRHVSFRYAEVRKVSDEDAETQAAEAQKTQSVPEPAAQAASAGNADENTPEDVLTDVSFSVAPGETIGILGATGCGKTTMVQLIPRLYDVTEGQILVDGTDVREYSLKNLRDGVAMVLQYNSLFSGSIAENLRWGDPEADDEKLRRFSEFAQADGFISSFEDGYEHMIEQGGTNVSGGQKQRLCIARALLKQPKILILDDSTSAVDTATEARIREAFATELKGTTKLIIAQRIGSVRNADRIIVMDDGRICATGSHEELLAGCREYQEIYYSQVEKPEKEAS